MELRIERTNTILYCRTWQPTVHFYREQLGLPVAFENEWFVEFALTGDSFLSVADARRATIADVGGQGVTLTLQVADVEEVRRQLSNRGIDPTPIQHRWGAAVFYCYDPEGHRLHPLSVKKRQEIVTRRKPCKKVKNRCQTGV